MSERPPAPEPLAPKPRASPPQAEPVTHIDDERFRVTEWRFAPGAETGWHRHGHDYVIVPLTDGVLGLDLAGGGRTEAALTRGLPYSRRVGVEHNVTNAGTAPLSFLEVEVVDNARDEARLATMARLMDCFNARDLDGLMGCMSADPAFHGAAGPGAEGVIHQGQAAVRAAYAALFAAFPDAAWLEGAHHITGETGLSTWRFRGTSAAGARVDVRGCDIFSFDGALIAVKDSYRKARG
ncbi:nuclear transport factor 2 family protein [Paracoccus sp. IB05]|uniref:nuclear transport factor 2 family protein n=1 Tax=Paracoccus sp. IB05 TaxID=2779367 RepID=UPI0018E88661|nr:nuclear transport factor 2 family protein [Paracoccus sp. IB05]MBJ2149918.1 nuclear transport factor 2 family protein [Paracoccus sp. IB05]